MRIKESVGSGQVSLKISDAELGSVLVREVRSKDCQAIANAFAVIIHGYFVELHVLPNPLDEPKEEPPAEVKDLFQLIDEFKFMAPGSDEYLETGAKILGLHMKNLWGLGDFGGGPSPVIVNADLRNTLLAQDKPFVWPYQRFWQAYYPDQWFYDK